MTKASNLWQLLQRTHDRTALMRACGVCEDTIRNSSDFDKLCAYADCMPLCQGHPMPDSDETLIQGLLGISVPICPESAASLWHAAAYALTGHGQAPIPPQACRITFTIPAQPKINILNLGHTYYATPTTELMMKLLNTSAQAIGVTVQIQSFVKPNPYTAKRLCEAERGTLTAVERDHLSAQTLRVLGKLCAERGSVLYVESDFAPIDAWCALLAYLQQSGCLAQIVLVVRSEDDLRAAATLAGCLPNPSGIPTVRVGVADVQEREALLDLYAALLPIGVLPPTDQ